MITGFLAALLFAGCDHKTEPQSAVKVIGAMKNVMHKGELFGTIRLDTLVNTKGLYGLGPVEYLTGELLILNGVSYKSTVLSDGSMHVEKTNKVKAPFFVYTNVEKWKEVRIPSGKMNLKQLEDFIDAQTQNAVRPFAFRLTGKINDASIHVVNLPKGTKVSSPEDAHRGIANFELQEKSVEIIGFFSTEHKAIFTHHDTYMHAHLITADKRQMGHLEAVEFEGRDMKLYLQQH